MFNQKPSTPALPQREIHLMFDRISAGYDRFNRLSSLGLDLLWRRAALRAVGPGMRVLDLGTGTGDLAIGAARRTGESGEVVGLDFSAHMLEGAARKSIASGSGRVRWVLGRAEELPLEEKPFDLVLSAFVLRNVHEHIDRVLSGVFESLRSGGAVSFVDLTEPPRRFAAAVLHAYLRTAGAVFGRICFGSARPVEYLGESMIRFPNAREFSRRLAAAGFQEIRSRSFLFGGVTHYSARRP